MINGCFAGGKSSVVKEISEQKDLFIISFDTIKKFFTKYDRAIHKDQVIAIMFEIQDHMMKLGYTILFDGILLGDIRRVIKEKAEKDNYETIEFNVEASLETALTRFKQRLNEIRERNAPTPHINGNDSEERFTERYDFYQKNKDKSAATFSSDTSTPKEIAKQIIKLANV